MDYDINEFITHHNSIHKYYCEAIIRPNGQITYAEPSHLMKLQEMWGVPVNQLFDGGPIRDKLAKEMPQTASPVHWLAEILNCVVLWYSAIIIPPNYTENQIQSIKKLMEHSCIDRNPSLEITMEYQLCDENNRNTTQLELICKHKQKLMNQVRSELCIKETCS